MIEGNNLEVAPAFWHSQYCWENDRYRVRLGHRYLSVHFIKQGNTKYERYAESIKPEIGLWLDVYNSIVNGSSEPFNIEKITFGYINTFKFKAEDFDLSNYFKIDFGADISKSNNQIDNLHITFTISELSSNITIKVFSNPADSKEIFVTTNIESYEYIKESATFEDTQKIVKSWPLVIYDRFANRPAQISKICKYEKPGLVIIDYLQLMNDDKGEKHQNRNSEIESISRKLKAIAKEYNCPVICLSQLNRALDGRGSKVPVLSDLRDSGSIEQDADMVIFPFRPSVYDPQAIQDEMQLIIAKHRNGRVGTVTIKHNQYLNNFFDENNNFAEPDFRANPDF